MYISHTTHILAQSFLPLIVYVYGICGNVTLRNIHNVYALFTRILKLLSKVFKKKSGY